MRALFQLRKLVNYLIKTGEIDSETRVNIELANEVNDKNWRKAIDDFQRANKKKNEEYRSQIVELCKGCGFDIKPTDDDIKKYRLWKEQNETCPYTGNPINFTDLFGPMPKFDFEHTIPRSLSYDDSLENLTLCDSEYNRNEKKQYIPSKLPKFDEINARFQKFYEEKKKKCEKKLLLTLFMAVMKIRQQKMSALSESIRHSLNLNIIRESCAALLVKKLLQALSTVN